MRITPPSRMQLFLHHFPPVPVTLPTRKGFTLVPDWTQGCSVSDTLCCTFVQGHRGVSYTVQTSLSGKMHLVRRFQADGVQVAGICGLVRTRVLKLWFKWVAC